MALSAYATTTPQSRPQTLSFSPPPIPTATMPAPGTANTSSDNQIAAFYEACFPRKVPHPDQYRESFGRKCSLLYVVTIGTSVGIFYDCHSPSPASDRVVVNLPDNHPSTPSTPASLPRLEPHDAIMALGKIVDFPPLQNLVLAPQGTSGGINSWGNLEVLDREWVPSQDKVSGPNITSLVAKGSGWGNSDNACFIWRSNSTSDCHVTHYTHDDLTSRLSPISPEKPSMLDIVSTDEWALIKSLHEAQQDGIPGPTFTLLQVKRRLSEIQACLSGLQAQVSKSEDRVKAIEARQADLHAEANGLDKEVYSIRDQKYVLENDVRQLVEVKKDLKDLQSIAYAYSI
ncbi:hypothetical protein AAF712_015145 [Marasmius tenuissimus]|uniref:Uncharacterized protein n=1 Tax=Marasmius tenuissimus TaxID=585030 RepID=A0ABR2ZA13_9AGAR